MLRRLPLFAASYAAYFLVAQKLAASQNRVRLDKANVTAKSGIGPRATGGSLITADLTVSLPSIKAAQVEALVDKAHQVFSYSNATWGNVDVGLTIA